LQVQITFMEEPSPVMVRFIVGLKNIGNRAVQVDGPCPICNFDLEVMPEGADSWESLMPAGSCAGGILGLDAGECAGGILERELTPGKYRARCRYESRPDPRRSWVGKVASPVIEFTVPEVGAPLGDESFTAVQVDSPADQDLQLQLSGTLVSRRRIVNVDVNLQNISDHAIGILRESQMSTLSLEVTAVADGSRQSLDLCDSRSESAPMKLEPDGFWGMSRECRLKPGKYRARCCFESQPDARGSWVGKAVSPVVEFTIPE
jgi:hypothetical protein